MQIVDDEEDIYDEVDGNVDENIAQKRILSGWYGAQEEGRQRMDTNVVFKALAKKAGCSPKDFQRNGLYKLTHGGDTYIGKAEKQPIGKRLIQHINDATSDRKLSGNVDEEIRADFYADNWNLEILPMQDNISVAEAFNIAMQQPNLNVQQPKLKV